MYRLCPNMQHVIYAVVCTAMHVYCTCMHCIELYATGHKSHAIRAQTALISEREGGQNIYLSAHIYSLTLLLSLTFPWRCASIVLGLLLVAAMSLFLLIVMVSPVCVSCSSHPSHPHVQFCSGPLAGGCYGVPPYVVCPPPYRIVFAYAHCVPCRPPMRLAVFDIYYCPVAPCFPLCLVYV